MFKKVVRFDGSGGGWVGFSVEEGFSVLGTAVVVVVDDESKVVEACVTVVDVVVAFSAAFAVSSLSTSSETNSKTITCAQIMFFNQS